MGEPGAPDQSDIEALKQATKKLGQRTWTLLWWQFLSLGTGESFLGAAILIYYRAKIF